MTVLSPALDAAFAADRVTMFGALKIELPEQTICLLDGSAEITIGADDYAGHVDGVGAWASVEEIEDGFGDEAPGTTVTILPDSDEAAAMLSDPANQASPVTIMVGARDDETGLSIGDPYIAIMGLIDVPVHEFGTAECSVDYDVVSEMDYLMMNDEDRDMAPAFHQRVWPGETGMNHVTGVTQNGYWGQNPPSGGTTNAGGFRRLLSTVRNGQ